MSEVKQTNEEDQTELEKLIRGGKPWLEENGTLLIYGLAAILAIAAVVVYINRQPSSGSAASRDVLMAVTPEEFRDVADNYPETKIGVWSRLYQADRLLDNCVTSMFTNREEAAGILDQAETAYQRLADRTDIEDQVRERVLIGLARVAEIKCDGSEESTKTAIDSWQRLLNEFEESLVKEHAEKRVERLATEPAKDFYQWFSEQNPMPAETPGLEPGQSPVPAMPETSSAESEADGEPEGDAAKADDPKTEEPEADNSGESKEEPQASDKAAATEKEKPAPEKEAAPAESPKPEPTTKDPAPAEVKPEASSEPKEPAKAESVPEEPPADESK